MAQISEWITVQDSPGWRGKASASGGGSASLGCIQTGVTWRGFGGTFNELGWISLQHTR